MASVTFSFEAETFADRTFTGEAVEVSGDGISVDGSVIAEPAGEESVYVLTPAAGQFAGQRVAVADLVE